MSDLTVLLTGQDLANYLKERFPPQELETTVNKLIKNIGARGNMQHIKPIQGESPLSKHVRCWINNQVEDDSYDAASVIREVTEHGCQSGIVGDLIYYSDTVKFYKKHRGDISALLAEILDSCGCGVSGLFGDSWDELDPLADDTQNQNLLAWFGFEETARNIANEIGVEL